MNELSLIFGITIILAVSYTIGNIVVEWVIPIKYSHLQDNPLIILLVGLITLGLICLAYKV